MMAPANGPESAWEPEKLSSSGGQLADGRGFGMCGRIECGTDFIASAGQKLAIAHDHRAHGRITQVFRPLRLFECRGHEALVLDLHAL
jgi:hypothetical protein